MSDADSSAEEQEDPFDTNLVHVMKTRHWVGIGAIAVMLILLSFT